MVTRRAVVAGGLLSLALGASAVGLGAPPASRAGGGRPAARPPATTLVLGTLLPAARCQPSPCREPLGLRRLRWKVWFYAQTGASGPAPIAEAGVPAAMLGRNQTFRIRLRPGCYGLSVMPYFPSGNSPGLLFQFDYQLRVGPRSPETVALRPLPMGAPGPCASPAPGPARPGSGSAPA